MPKKTPQQEDRHSFALWLTKNFSIGLGKDQWIHVHEQKFYTSFEVILMYEELLKQKELK